MRLSDCKNFQPDYFILKENELMFHVKGAKVFCYIDDIKIDNGYIIVENQKNISLPENYEDKIIKVNDIEFRKSSLNNVVLVKNPFKKIRDIINKLGKNNFKYNLYVSIIDNNLVIMIDGFTNFIMLKTNYEAHINFVSYPLPIEVIDLLQDNDYIGIGIKLKPLILTVVGYTFGGIKISSVIDMSDNSSRNNIIKVYNRIKEIINDVTVIKRNKVINSIKNIFTTDIFDFNEQYNILIGKFFLVPFVGYVLSKNN